MPRGETTLVFGLRIIKNYKWGDSLLPKHIFNSAWNTHRSCFWFCITYSASPKYDRIRHDNSLSPICQNLSWTHRNLFNSTFKAFYKYLMPHRNGWCNSSHIPAKKFLKMSGNGKLIATEPSPHKPMISPGRQAGNAIAQAIELPAAKVRVWTSPHLKPGDSCPSSRRQRDIQISLYSLKELSFFRIAYFLFSFIFKDWTSPILPLFAL